jgi:imidazolonepropionase-like amidohydrolase
MVYPIKTAQKHSAIYLARLETLHVRCSTARFAPFHAVAIVIMLLLGSAASPPAAAASAQRIAIVGAKVYVSPDEQPIADADAVILIENGRIKRVGPRKSTPIPRGYRTIDRPGHVVTAGFWNSHIHFTTPLLLRAKSASDEELGRELQADFTRWGFTTVFDLASTTEIARDVRDRTRARVDGPRVLSVGEPFYPTGATPIYARPFYEKYQLPSAEIVSTRQAVQRVQEQVVAGADGIKLFTGSIVGGERGVVHMPAVVIAEIVKSAHRSNKRVFAHPTDRFGLEAAVTNGVDILAHTAPLMGTWSPEYARWIAGRRVALIPTLSLLEVMPDPSTPVGVAIQQTAELHRAGGIILFGTDAGFTDVFDTTLELQLLNRAIGWKGVLASLTTNPAQVFGDARNRGRILPGYIADIVVLAGDPAERIENAAAVQLVIKAGRIIYAK